MTFLGHTWIQATTLVVKELTNRGSSPFVPVTQIMLIVSRRPGLCGKLISSKTCLLESDWWFSWGVIDVFAFSLYLCPCAVRLHPAGPIWWTDLGSIISPAGVPFRVRVLAPTAPWVIWDHLQQACPEHTTTEADVGRCKRNLCGFDDFHIWEVVCHCWSPIRTQQGAQSFEAQLEQVTPGKESCGLFKETS